MTTAPDPQAPWGTSGVDYQRRFHRVLAFIDQHLDRPLDLATLADVAHFSPFYFHRLFAAWTGETLGTYLRRRRVETAAMRMAAQPRLSVLNAALGVGFGSGEAFSRAFRLRFGASPTAWRKQASRERTGRQSPSNPGQVIGNPDQDGWSARRHTAVFPNPLENDMTKPLNVTLINRSPTRVAYLRYTGPAGEPVSQFWQTVYYPWAATHGLLEQPRYGISHDDPGINGDTKLRYDACVEVPADFKALGGAMLTTLPGGRYAACRFRGTGADFPAGWAALLRDWLPASGLQLDARPSFEYYGKDASFDPTTGIMVCDICIPVSPL